MISIKILLSFPKNNYWNVLYGIQTIYSFILLINSECTFTILLLPIKLYKSSINDIVWLFKTFTVKQKAFFSISGMLLYYGLSKVLCGNPQKLLFNSTTFRIEGSCISIGSKVLASDQHYAISQERNLFYFLFFPLLLYRPHFHWHCWMTVVACHIQSY